MKTHLTTIAKCLATLALCSCFIFSKCNKEDALGEYYFRCKIEGELYRPNNCANCERAQLLRDTVFLTNGNAGFESVLLGVAEQPSIRKGTYVLNSPRSGAAYDNSPQVDDIFRTDSLRTGQLIITALDKTNKIVSGTFYFKAYNPVQGKTVNITEGKFRLKYTDY